jgi:GTPase SAR1 family protein
MFIIFYWMEITLVVVGAGGSGKTSFVRRFIENEYSYYFDSTLEEKFTKTIQFKGKEISLVLIDTIHPNGLKKIK